MKIILIFSFFCVQHVFSQSTYFTGELKNNKGFLPASSLFILPQGIEIKTDEKGIFHFDLDSPQTITLVFEEKAVSIDLTPIVDSFFFSWNIDSSEQILEELVIKATVTKQTAFITQELKGEHLEQNNATNLAEGLNFAVGLRVETGCQTCNYTQLRINGLSGSYAQILINGKPLFSSLMGLYGLEQVPLSIIDKLEVTRGAGSVLVPANAVGGTVNVITKLPERNQVQLSSNKRFYAQNKVQHNLQGNASFINKKKDAGLIFLGSLKSRGAIDQNGDGFSELPRLSSYSFALTGEKKVNHFSFSASAWYLQEERQGGDHVSENPQLAEQSEFRLQKTLINQLNAEWLSDNKAWKVGAYTSAQNTTRKHYTGIDQADGWGTTQNLSVQSGLDASYTSRVGKHQFIWSAGAGHLFDDILDEIRGYNYKIDQTIQQKSGYLQNEWKWGRKFTLITGVRSIHHSRLTKLAHLPRLAAIYKLNGQWSIQSSYGLGIRAPQAFETDMHMAFASGGVAIIKIDPSLKPERSNSLNVGLSWNKRRKKSIYEFSLNYFNTQILNPFVLTEIKVDTSMNTYLLRTNGSNGKVEGISFSGAYLFADNFQIDLGYTIQQSVYASEQTWSAELPGVRSFLRTPNDYGYFTLTLFPKAKWTTVLNAVYTGTMLVPHFGGSPEQAQDELKKTRSFLDLGIRVQRSWHLHKSEQDIKVAFAVQNLLNAYQNDFDTTKNRDSNYIYGPANPRSFTLSLSWGIDSKTGKKNLD